MDIIAFTVGGICVYWYGIMISLAVCVGLFVARYVTAWQNISYENVINILLISLPMAVIGARGFYVITHWYLFSNNLGEIFMIQHGGVSVYGAFAGFLGAVYFYVYQHGGSVWRFLDILAPSIFITLAIIQFGNFVLQTTVGTPAQDGRIVEYIEYAFRPVGFRGYEYFRPVALYQGGYLMLVFGLSFFMHTAWGFGSHVTGGRVFLSGMLLVCLGRFGFGFMYLSNADTSLHLGQIIALAGIIACLVLLWINKRKSITFRQTSFRI